MSRLGPQPAGRFCASASDSELCPPGHYCPLGSVAPVECLAGSECPEGSARERAYGVLAGPAASTDEPCLPRLLLVCLLLVCLLLVC